MTKESMRPIENILEEMRWRATAAVSVGTEAERVVQMQAIADLATATLRDIRGDEMERARQTDAVNAYVKRAVMGGGE